MTVQLRPGGRSNRPTATRNDRPTDPVDEILPARSMITLGLQHVLVIYAGVVAVPLVLSGALGLTSSQTVTLVNANLLLGGDSRPWCRPSGSGASARGCR